MVYELRCYTLSPGKMPEYLKAAETIGRPARGQNFGVNHGYWTAEFGALNQIWHLWKYDSYEERTRLRGELMKNEKVDADFERERGRLGDRNRHGGNPADDRADDRNRLAHGRDQRDDVKVRLAHQSEPDDRNIHGGDSRTFTRATTPRAGPGGTTTRYCSEMRQTRRFPLMLVHVLPKSVVLYR